MIDLHTHTTASDGQYSPKELVYKVAEKNMSVLAITDHDTIAGLKEGAEACKEKGIIFVPGIEINIQRPNCEFHLLGLGLNLDGISESLNNVINNLIESRYERNKFIVSKMHDFGIETTVEEIQVEFPNQVLGRPHFASWLVNHHYVKNRQAAFDKFLARDRPWYVERMECFHPGARVTECLRLQEIAKRLGFFVTAGSDFHGEKVRADRRPGHTCGEKIIEDKFYFEELKPFLDKMHGEK